MLLALCDSTARLLIVVRWKSQSSQDHPTKLLSMQNQIMKGRLSYQPAAIDQFCSCVCFVQCRPRPAAGYHQQGRLESEKLQSHGQGRNGSPRASARRNRRRRLPRYGRSRIGRSSCCLRKCAFALDREVGAQVIRTCCCHQVARQSSNFKLYIIILVLFVILIFLLIVGGS